tara:strand:- start:2352 stop:2540 length:189 start_codon:yes stop_codon:yes gene_type:complete
MNISVTKHQERLNQIEHSMNLKKMSDDALKRAESEKAQIAKAEQISRDRNDVDKGRHIDVSV